MRVLLCALGGTISMAGRTAGDSTTGRTAGGVAVRLTGADLVAAVPGLSATGVEVTVADVRAVPGGSLTFDDLLNLVDLATAAVERGATGVVVTQGTDTIEETAYLLHLLWRPQAPIVVTGAMRNPTLAGPDGPANLLAAITVAADPAARGYGCVVAFNDEIHSARWVRKAHSTNPGTFTSPDTGPVGHLVEGRPALLVPAAPRLVLPRPTGPVPPVALYTTTLDDDGAQLEEVAGRYAGLVVAGFGVGHVPAWIAPRLGDLARRMPVLLASRTGAGPVLRATYAGPGSESDLRGRGLIDAGMLHPYKARILLRLLLAGGADRERVAAVVADQGGTGR